MSTAWTLPTTDILTDALELIGQLGAGQTASAEDYDVCNRALQNILKELPLHGYTWPKITAPRAALAWSALLPGQVSLPADYYGSPVVTFAQASSDIALRIISKAAYEAIPQQSATATHPTHLYIAPNNIGYLWPVPTLDPGLSITYQAIASDAELDMTPDVAQTWIGGLGLWVAYEICPKFGVDLATRADIEKRFLMRRALMLKNAAETAPICFGVAE
jgi:hypothetical protein